MKKIFLVASILLMFAAVKAQSGMNIGKCKFIGKKPSSSNIAGLMQYYHNGNVKRTKIEGGKDVYTGIGDVWVIFKSREVAEKTVFRVTGNVQICNDY